MVKKCIVCGKVYTTESKLSKYCSHACCCKQWKLNNRLKDLAQRKAYNKRRWLKIKPTIFKRHCLFCDKLFRPDRKHNFQQYCSGRCRRKNYVKNNRDKVLLWKKNDRIKHKEQYSKRDAKYHDKTRYGGNRRKAMVRDEFMCKICGEQYPDVRLVVHHVDGTGQDETPNQELNNLQTLCRACHARSHKLIV